MTIQSSEIKFYRSAVVSDAAGNGGVMGTAEVVDAVKNNLFPDITATQRTAGLTRYRKVFAHIANADDLALLNAYAYLARGSVGDDYLTMFVGTQSDTQGDISSPREYGVAPLTTAASATDTEIECTLEVSGHSAAFVTGDTIAITDGTNTEIFENVTMGIVGTALTITLDGTDQLANSYLTSNTWVATVYEMVSPTDIQTSSSGWTETSSSGTYDESGNPLVLENIGTVEDDWTLTFSDATNFSVTGATTGSVGSGTTGGDFAPANGSGTYFTLAAAGWAGTWANGETVEFSTHPAALPLWIKQVVPAGAAASSLPSPKITVGGESE